MLAVVDEEDRSFQGDHWIRARALLDTFLATRDYCAALGIEYLVLERAPAPGLPQRTSTDLRGF